MFAVQKVWGSLKLFYGVKLPQAVVAGEVSRSVSADRPTVPPTPKPARLPQ